MQWKFFLGACVLTAALLQPHAPMKSIIGGMALAAFAIWTRSFVSRQRQRSHASRDSDDSGKGR